MLTRSCIVKKGRGAVASTSRCGCQIHNSSPVFWQSWRRVLMNERRRFATGNGGGGGGEGGGGHEPCCVTVTVVTVTPAVSAFCVCVCSADHLLVGEKTRKRAGGGPVWLGCLPALFPDPIRFLLRVSCPSGIFDTRCCRCSRYHDGPMGRTEDSAAPV
ncbi:hypothetical protein GE21DRAFT_1085961 [Neurospora crassa]|nr:hypothetical protein GE21DRAFT_1085961 [Neurospora crassa]